MSERSFDTEVFVEKILVDYPTIVVADFRIDDHDINFYALRHPKETTKDVLYLVLFYDSASSEFEYALDLLEQQHGYIRCKASEKIYEKYGIPEYATDDDDDEYEMPSLEAPKNLPRY